MLGSRKPLASGDPLSRDPSGPVLLAVCIALVIGLASAVSAQEAASESDALRLATGNGFSDHWILNAELSENPREKMQQAMQGGGGRGGGMRGGGGGGQGGGGGGGQGGGSGGQGGRGGGRGSGGGGGRGSMASVFANATELVIVHEGSTFSIRTPDGNQRDLTISEPDTTQETAPGTIAYWDSAALVVESTRAEGPSVVERYELVEGTRRLVITATITLPSGGDPISVRRVYDAAEATS